MMDLCEGWHRVSANRNKMWMSICYQLWSKRRFEWAVGYMSMALEWRADSNGTELLLFERIGRATEKKTNIKIPITSGIDPKFGNHSLRQLRAVALPPELGWVSDSPTGKARTELNGLFAIRHSIGLADFCFASTPIGHVYMCAHLYVCPYMCVYARSIQLGDANPNINHFY